jgi:creatinine amidohydrolase
MEIRDAIRTGTTTIIIGTGGVEQNGPYVAGGKHNYVLQTVLPYIARVIGKALIDSEDSVRLLLFAFLIFRA